MKFIIAAVLILCITPCLFIIPVFCAPIELTILEKTDFCPLLSFAITSDTLILAEAIIYPGIPEGFTPLEDNDELFNPPIVFFAKDKPPAV